ncbi:MAG TPA: RNA polymerase sigma factor [Saprospiraceae bacterium]|nr:RNA polymerase sigma factor [Saprospiraceae bacterium]
MKTSIRHLVPKKRGSAKQLKTTDQTLKTRTLNYADTHKEIVEKCKAGDRQAQFELYRLYSKAMYNVCLRMVKDELDAEDLLQNSFVDIFTKLDSFRYQSSVGAWIKRIVINNCINYLKKKKIYFQELEDRHAAVPEEGITHADDTKGLSVKAVKQALFDLPDGYRVVFSLYMLEGYDHKEIGDILGIAETTSKSQYSRAKAKLRDILRAQKLVSNL